jgi:hypothetical protein
MNRARSVVRDHRVRMPLRPNTTSRPNVDRFMPKIRFQAKLTAIGAQTILRVPKAASSKLPAHSTHRDQFVQTIVIERSSDRDRSEATLGTSVL